MAARKPEKQYIALYSDCGNDSQLKTIGGDDGVVSVCGTIDSAKREAAIHAADARDNGEDPSDYVIAEIVARGAASQLVWK